MRTKGKSIVAGLMVIPLVGFNSGCGSNEIDRADVPPVPIPEAVSVEDMPEEERPGGGSSAKMDYDPTRGGVMD